MRLPVVLPVPRTGDADAGMSTITQIPSGEIVFSAVKNKPSYAIESVDNALHLAQLLLLQGPMRVTEAAGQLGVSPSTAHRLLAMLVYRDFAEQGPDRLYRPGPALRNSGTSQAPLALLRRVAQPHLQRLVDRVNESANLVVLTGTEVRFVTTVECQQVLRVGDRSGKALPAHLTSAGKAMLALLDEERVNSILAPLNEGERSRVRREVAAARRNGYAVNNQRTETGLTALGVAVRAPDGRFVVGASLAMPAVRFAKDKVEEWVRELAACAAAIEWDVARHLTATSE
jgi:IclR family acetate operon transcriptional repressor